ncbi:DNA-3-methyladenine glycosylase [Nocardioides sp. Kera G14]|uniref:DNA-3-methyladenine glycosylase n=1 Tax=Nocardioides sp. Kera G14 TaxID=2884264 RepID=UPI001D1165BF|nr:DNA-3-methyladenine glycosylase [Nocardioides sp. Kera G14]UDY25278.1 DNA-3-methyladenine glycosylase [Nocardioides sp. Kera G14]
MSAELLEGRPDEVAPRLLGALVSHAGVTLRLTEVEAYGGPEPEGDPGSHAFRGKTARNAVMFGGRPALYVYFTYGMHHCANLVVTEGPGGVLMRAGEVVDGIDVARTRRPRSSDRDLARGPARLAQALAFDLSHNGLPVPGPEIGLVAPAEPSTGFCQGPRVGLRFAPDRPWRFWVPGEPTVSTYRPAQPRPRKAV